MPSFYLMQVLVALIAIATVDSFIPIGSCSRPTTTTRTSSSLYGIFDSIGKAFGNEEYGAPPDAVKATARHILVPTIEDANKVLAEIGKGETSFAALASQYSTCPSSSRGGSLGSFAPGTMVKEFDEVVFAPNTKVGSILGPVQTQFGYHLICVDKRTGGGDWY